MRPLVEIHDNQTNCSKVGTKISICRAVPWERPFCLYYPECNIPCFRNVVPVELPQGFSI